MKIVGYLLLAGALLALMVAPSYLVINYYNHHVKNNYKLPVIKTIALSLVSALMVSGLMGVDFEGAAFSWLVTVFMLHGLSLVVGVGVFTLIRYLSNNA